MDREGTDQLLSEADHAFSKGSFESALKAYQAVLTVEPSTAWAHNRIGAILAQQGDMVGAERALRSALELDPNLAQAHSNLGNLDYARGEYELALAKYQEALRLTPTNPLFHENLHAVYKKLGRLSEAVAALKQAHRLQREGVRDHARARYKATKQAVKGGLGCITGLLSILLLFVLAILF